MSIRKLLRKRRGLAKAVEVIYNLFNSMAYPWLSEPAYTVTTAIADPFGSNKAVRTELVSGTQLATRRMSYTPAGEQNFSCYVRKVASTTNATFRIVIAGSRGGGFDLNTQTIALNVGNVSNLVITDEGNGWYRCSVGTTCVAGEQVMMEYVNLAPGDIFEWYGQQHTVGSRDLLPFQFTDSNTPRE